MGDSGGVRRRLANAALSPQTRLASRSFFFFEDEGMKSVLTKVKSGRMLT